MKALYRAEVDEAAVIVHKYLAPDGSEMSIGGTERKSRDVVSTLNRMGLPCIVYQKAEKAFCLQTSERVRVVGLPAKRGRLGDLLFNLMVFKFARRAKLRVYVGMHLAYPFLRNPCIVFNVGIWWDSPKMGWIWRALSKHICKSVVTKADKIICVDANFINWFRATYNIKNVEEKLHFIPNYVAPEIEEAFEKYNVRSNKDKTVILFPRRLQYERGVFIFLEAMCSIAKDFPEIEIHLVGEHHWRERREFVQNLVTPDVMEKVKIYSVPLVEMGRVYATADIVVVPTLACEGTSYSLIEAMFFAKPVVTTYVGGISNIAIDGFNAVVVPPLTKGLEAGIRKLLQDAALRQKISENARKTAQALSFSRWQERLTSLLRSVEPTV